MAWRNLWRNPHRTIINMAAILFAVLLSVLASSLKAGIFDNLVRNLVGYYSGAVQIHRAGYWNEQTIENSFSQVSGLEGIVTRDSRIRAVSARLESFALAVSQESTRGCMVVGVMPGSEDKVTGVRSRILSGRYPAASDSSVMPADGLLKRLNARVGDTLILLGQGYHSAMAAGKYPIAASVRFGLPDLNNNLLFMPLPEARNLFSAAERNTSYVIALYESYDPEAVAQSLRKELGGQFEVMTWDQMMPDVRQHIRADSANMQVVQAILYLLVCFGIFSTLLMMMVERKSELRLLLAIGMRKERLSMMLFVESLLTLTGGCLLGLVAAVPVVVLLSRYPIRIHGQVARAYEQFGFEAVFPTSVNPVNFYQQGLIVLGIALLLSVYPVIGVFRLNPVTEIRN